MSPASARWLTYCALLVAGLAAAALLLAGVSRSLVQARRSPVALVVGATLAGYGKIDVRRE